MISSFYNVYDIKVHIRDVGDRADYCPGCLQLSRFTFKTVEESTRICLVPLGYHEVDRVKECAICGTIVRGRPDELYSTDPEAPLERLVAMTNPGLTEERIATIEAELENADGHQTRRQKSLECFLRRQAEAIANATWNGDLPTTIIDIALGSLCIAATIFVRPVWWVPICLASAWIAWRFRCAKGHRRAAKRILPRLSRFLAAYNMSFAQFEVGLRIESRESQRLLRHFTAAAYDDLRVQATPPQKNELFFCQE